MTATVSPGILDHDRSPFARVLINVSEGADLVTAMSEADLLFSVEKYPAWTFVPEPGGNPLDSGQMVRMPSNAAIVRRNLDGSIQPLTTIGEGYEVVQNFDAFSPLAALHERGLITFTQAGQTMDGRKVFVLAELTNQASSLSDADPHKRFIMASTTHDGTGSLRFRPWMQRLFCTNQYPMLFGKFGARKDRGEITIKHTSYARDAVKVATNALSIAVGTMDEFEKALQELMGRDATHHVNEFVAAVLPIDSDATERSRRNIEQARDKMREVYYYSPTMENVRGTAAGLLHAAVEWSDYYSLGDGEKSPQRRATRILHGTDVALKERAARAAMLVPA